MLPDEMRREAESAIARMREAAAAARDAHARAELLRHMLTTAARVAHLPRAEAVAAVSREWMAAWHLSPDAYPGLSAEIRGFTAACCGFAEAGDATADAALRRALAALDAALAAAGTTLADQMAWRSECAHGWWQAVVPVPPDLPGRAERPGVPRAAPDAPFWTAGAAPHCGAT
jgi:hypothetical protein